MGLAAAYGPFHPAVYNPIFLEKAGGHLRKDHHPGRAYQRSRGSLRELWGFGFWRDGGDPAAAHKERGGVKLTSSFALYGIWGVIT